MHTGIYAPLAEDAVSESRAAAQGGVTSSLNYMRTGQYYLNRGGPYRTFMPEVFKQSDGRFWIDYGYHIAPITLARYKKLKLVVPESSLSLMNAIMKGKVAPIRIHQGRMDREMISAE